MLFEAYAGRRGQAHGDARARLRPDGGAHDYERRGEVRVTFRVDGVVLCSWTTGVPTAPMNLFANAWFPAWLDGLAPAKTARQRSSIRSGTRRAEDRANARCDRAGPRVGCGHDPHVSPRRVRPARVRRPLRRRGAGQRPHRVQHLRVQRRPARPATSGPWSPTAAASSRRSSTPTTTRSPIGRPTGRRSSTAAAATCQFEVSIVDFTVRDAAGRPAIIDIPKAPDGTQSSQPAWFPDMSGLLYRRTNGTGTTRRTSGRWTSTAPTAGRSASLPKTSSIRASPRT